MKSPVSAGQDRESLMKIKLKKAIWLAEEADEQREGHAGSWSTSLSTRTGSICQRKIKSESTSPVGSIKTKTWFK